MDNEITALDIGRYNGNIKREFLDKALKALNQYKSDKEELITRIRDNERIYKRYYSRTLDTLNSKIHSDTPFIFSSIENAVADAAENYPIPNILERSPEGAKAASALSSLLPTLLVRTGFYSVYKRNSRNKHRFGTAIYGVFYNDKTKDIDIRIISIFNIYVDMSFEDIQDSPFLFITAMVSNDDLKEDYPEYAEIFTGDATLEAADKSRELHDYSEVCDCYYKKHGHVHMMKLCRGEIIEATEDMGEDYENGIYDHGKYPVVFDVLYPVPDCPFGFGMIDVGKSTQLEIDKLGKAIDENILINAKPRYFAKEICGVNEDEFNDWSKNIVHCSGDPDGITPMQATAMSQYFLEHRNTKKDELKELLANRDFQQGATSGGVTAASAIQTLQQAGEKRSRSQMKDTYDAFRTITSMVIELIRQFYNDERTYRTGGNPGEQEFVKFSNAQMTLSKFVPDTEPGAAGLTTDYAIETLTPFGHYEFTPIEFDIDIVPQRENPFTKEAQNNTILTIFTSSLMSNPELAILALQNMSFDRREKLVSDLRSYLKTQQEMAAQQQQAQQPAAQSDSLIPVEIGAEDQMQQMDTTSIPEDEEIIPIPITGGMENV